MKRMNFPHRREKRRLEAQERQDRFDLLTEGQKAERRRAKIVKKFTK
jgi:hypothetical protein